MVFDLKNTGAQQIMPDLKAGTEGAIDWRYNCSASNGCPRSTPSAIGDLVTAQGGTGIPAGFTRWTSVYSCSPGDTVVPRGNWYIDCPTGLSTGGTLTFRGGNIVSDNAISVSGNGSLRVNCDVASSATACPSDPATTSTIFMRNGGISKSGNVSFTLLETFVYFANGTVTLSGDSKLTWTAPNDPASPFDETGPQWDNVHMPERINPELRTHTVNVAFTGRRR